MLSLCLFVPWMSACGAVVYYTTFHSSTHLHSRMRCCHCSRLAYYFNDSQRPEAGHRQGCMLDPSSMSRLLLILLMALTKESFYIGPCIGGKTFHVSLLGKKWSNHGHRQ